MKKRTVNYEFIFIMFFLSCVLLSSFQKKKEILPTLGFPIEFIEEQPQLTKSIDQIANDDKRLYLLLDASGEGIVAVYTLEGIYLKSIKLSNHANGAFKIAVHNGIFYICDKEGHLYLYKDGIFTEFIYSRQCADLRKSINFESASSTYIIRMGSVWHITENGSKCVIERPGITMLYQNNLYPIFLILLVAVGGFYQYRMSRKQEH